MKTFRNSSAWKTDPRAAYIPGAALFSLIIIFCLITVPAWSFETVYSQHDNQIEVSTKHSKQALTSYPPQAPSPTVADSCLPLLKSIRQNSPTSAMDRNQRSAGKAAALGLVFGVRFALSPPEKAKAHAKKPRFDVWQTSGASAGDRNALAVSAYRQCQKEQALQALSEFRWKR